MRDLTGCPSFSHAFKDFSTDELKEKIAEAIGKEYLVCVNTDESNPVKTE
jgi:hypothetical protein